MTLYRYGPIAWFWRAIIALGLLAGMACIAAGVVVPAIPIVVPALFFGLVVVVRVDRIGDALDVRTLLWRRYVPRARLGSARRREYAQSEAGPIHAPRLWVPVRGGLPLYFDLLASIPDRGAFEAALRGR